MRGTSAKCVDEYVAIVHDQLRATLWEAQAQATAEVQWQKWYYDQKIGTMALKTGDLVLVKADAFKGKRKIKDRWEGEPHKVVDQITMDIPSYKVTNQCRQSCILHCNWLFLITSQTGVPLCVGVHHAQDRCTNPTLVKPTPKGSESKIRPQGDSGLAITQCQASKTSLGWINGKLWLLPWTSARVFTEDGWRLQVMCSGSGCLQDCVCWWKNSHLQPVDAIGQQTEQLPWLLIEPSNGSKTIGGTEWVSTLHVKFFNDLLSSTLMQNTPTQSKRDPCCHLKGGFTPLLHQTRRNINTSNSTKPDKAKAPGHV